jgi:hypothetical protein
MPELRAEPESRSGMAYFLPERSVAVAEPKLVAVTRPPGPTSPSGPVGRSAVFRPGSGTAEVPCRGQLGCPRRLCAPTRAAVRRAVSEETVSDPTGSCGWLPEGSLAKSLAGLLSWVRQRFAPPSTSNAHVHSRHATGLARARCPRILRGGPADTCSRPASPCTGRVRRPGPLPDVALCEHSSFRAHLRPELARARVAVRPCRFSRLRRLAPRARCRSVAPCCRPWGSPGFRPPRAGRPGPPTTGASSGRVRPWVCVSDSRRCCRSSPCNFRCWEPNPPGCLRAPVGAQRTGACMPRGVASAR